MAEINRDVASTETLSLRSVFSTDCILTIGRGIDKSSAIRQLVERLGATGKLRQGEIDNVTNALIDRENLGTTGMGKGLAIPHLRTKAVTDPAGAIGIAPEGIDFQSLDGAPTRLVVLLLSPPSRGREHGEILGKIARLLCDRTLQYRVQIPRAPEELFSFLEFD
jgi:mannitol/fructose-specific phosphotransferase system IIA component (Ntr-type)